MSDIPREPKPTNKWGRRELMAFNITVVRKSVEEFFGHPLPTELDVSPVILDSQDCPKEGAQEDLDFFSYLEDAQHRGTDEAFLPDFVVYLLRLMGYNKGINWTAHTHPRLTFEMCGRNNVPAQPDACVLYRARCSYSGKYSLIVREDKVRHILDFGCVISLILTGC